MKNYIIFISLLLMPGFASAHPDISYKVFYQDSLGHNGLKVQVQYYNQESADSTVLVYANNFWGEDSLQQCITVLSEDNPGITIKQEADKGLIRLYHPGSKNITFTYRLKQDYQEPNYYITGRPRIHNEYFHILGQSLFAVPFSLTGPPFDKEVEIKIDWLDFPKNFVLHNTFASQQRSQTIRTTLWDGFYNSLFVGGDYRIRQFAYHGKPVFFAIRGKWLGGYTDDFLFSNFEKAIKSQRDFWKDYNQEYFTLVLTPTVTSPDSATKMSVSIGTAVHGGFMIQSSNNHYNDKDAYVYTLHHELMHEWIGHKIQNKYKELNYWFSEGFTDYYTYKNRLRIKDISMAEWLERFNKEVIAAHWKNPEKHIPNYKIKDGFWASRDVEKVPYRRGALFAFWLDNQVLLKSNYTRSLDDMMLDLLQRCTKNGTQLSDELVIDIANDYLEQDIAYFFQKHIINGEEIDLAREQWIEGFVFKIKEGIPQLELTGTAPRYILK